MDLLDVLGVPSDRRGYFQHMLTTALKLYEDGASTGDLKVTNTALKELRYAYKVFAPYRDVRKVTVFGSARTAPTQSAAMAALIFGRRMVEEGWMVVTGAGGAVPDRAAGDGRPARGRRPRRAGDALHRARRGARRSRPLDDRDRPALSVY